MCFVIETLSSSSPRRVARAPSVAAAPMRARAIHRYVASATVDAREVRARGWMDRRANDVGE